MEEHPLLWHLSHRYWEWAHLKRATLWLPYLVMLRQPRIVVHSNLHSNQLEVTTWPHTADCAMRHQTLRCWIWGTLKKPFNHENHLPSTLDLLKLEQLSLTIIQLLKPPVCQLACTGRTLFQIHHQLLRATPSNPRSIALCPMITRSLEITTDLLWFKVTSAWIIPLILEKESQSWSRSQKRMQI